MHHAFRDKPVILPLALLGLLALTLGHGGWACSGPAVDENNPRKHERHQMRNDMDNESPATLRDALERDVRHRSEHLGERHVERPKALAAAADYIADAFAEAGYAPERQSFDAQGVTCQNIIAELPGRGAADQVVVFGAHYDSIPGSPGANDNATGVAAMLALARAAREFEPARTMRFVAFVNEEPPFFQTDQMGSMVYAQRVHERGENIVAMVSFDGLGYYSDEPGSQQYPSPLLRLFYPSTGNFISVVGNRASRALTKRIVDAFRASTDFPIVGAAVPGTIPQASFSDHASFWQYDYPGVMITDTLPFRYPHYHEPTDLPRHIDFDRMARVVEGMQAVMRALSEPPASNGP